MATSPMNEVMQHLRRAVLVRDGAGLSDGELLEVYLGHRDEAALAALVRRHGPMVWGVCRRLLGHHDAEDAFQATFLVLVRKARSIMPRELVGNWLYGVAHQTALKARGNALKRKQRERQVTTMPEPATAEPLSQTDLEARLDQELSRLPEKYRAVIVLCDLEGKTRKEVAQQLALPEGTIGSRLGRARAMLAKRLVLRGLPVTSAALAGFLSAKAASAAVPTLVLTRTVQAASGLAAGQALATGAISARAIGLAEGVLKAMLLNNLKGVLAVVVALGTLALACPLLVQGRGDGVRRPKERAALTPGTKGKSATMNALEKLQGTWELVAAEEHGRAVPDDIVKNRLKMTVTVQGDGLTLQGARLPKPIQGKLRLDLTKKPKRMEWAAVRPEEERFLNLKGIYDVQGDTWTFCYGEERPTEFKTKPARELDQRLFVLKRSKPAAAK